MANNMQVSNYFSNPGEGGTWIIFDGGVWPKVWNPYQYLRIFLPQKTDDLTVFFFFFRNFCKSGPIFKGFSTSKMADLQFLWNGTLF